MKFKFEGIEELEDKLEDLVSFTNLSGAVKDGCLIVEGAAREKAPKYRGDLIRSIESEVKQEGESVVGYVGTPLEYAPYIEYGTGIFAEGGKGKQQPWYIPIGNEFTEAMAEKYHFPIIEGENGMKWAKTHGAHPHPFLRPALKENKEKVLKVIAEGITNG